MSGVTRHPRLPRPVEAVRRPSLLLDLVTVVTVAALVCLPAALLLYGLYR